MSIKAKIEAIVYAAEEPVTFEQIFSLAKGEARQELAQRRNEAGPALPDADPQPEQQSDEQLPPLETGGEVAASVDDSQPVGVTPTVPAECLPVACNAGLQAGCGEGVHALTDTANPEAAETQAPAQEEEIDTQDRPAGTNTPEGEPADSPAPLPDEPNRITDAEIKSEIRAALEELIADYNRPEHGIEIRQVAGGYRMSTKPEQHESVRAFAKSLKPPLRLSLQALETLAVIAYKQPITVPEISEIRGVDTGGVIGTLLDRKLIATSGRKQVIGRPILYKTSKEFLLRFGLKDLTELPSMEEFEKLAAESLGADLFSAATPEQSPVPNPPAENAEDSADQVGQGDDDSKIEPNETAAPTNEPVAADKSKDIED